MKLLRYGPAGAEKPGLLDGEGRVRDLSSYVDDLNPASVSLESLNRLRALNPGSLPVVSDPGRIGCPLAWVPNFHAIGLNYVKHAAETGMAEPAEPIIFTKATTSLSGPYDAVRLPRGSVKGDWEVELGAVIGRDTHCVSEKDAASCVAGYCIINDVSERAFQLESPGQWVKGKSAPTFGPVGPWLVTADEVRDPQKLALKTVLNGETVQDSNTDDMIFTVAQIVSHMSQYMMLRAGDIIATGTPEGVGMGMKPQRFLKVGDVMEMEIEGLGRQRQEVLDAD